MFCNAFCMANYETFRKSSILQLSRHMPVVGSLSKYSVHIPPPFLKTTISLGFQKKSRKTNCIYRGLYHLHKVHNCHYRKTLINQPVLLMEWPHLRRVHLPSCQLSHEESAPSQNEALSFPDLGCRWPVMPTNDSRWFHTSFGRKPKKKPSKMEGRMSNLMTDPMGLVWFTPWDWYISPTLPSISASHVGKFIPVP